MKAFLSLAATLLVSLSFPSAQERARSAAAQPRSPLELNTKIVGQRRCALDRATDMLHLRLQLRYTNVGDEKVILYSGYRLFYQTSVRRAAGGAARDELYMTSAWYFDEHVEKIEADAPGKVFRILSPGGAYSTEITVSLPVSRTDSSVAAGRTIAPGEHVLRLTTSTWYESKALADKLRERWRRNGLLWANPITSSPLDLKVEAQTGTVACR